MSNECMRAVETNVSYNLIHELLDKLDLAFPDKLPFESEMLNNPHKVWMNIGARKVIEFIRRDLTKGKDD